MRLLLVVKAMSSVNKVFGADFVYKARIKAVRQLEFLARGKSPRQNKNKIFGSISLEAGVFKCRLPRENSLWIFANHKNYVLVFGLRHLGELFGGKLRGGLQNFRLGGRGLCAIHARELTRAFAVQELQNNF